MIGYFFVAMTVLLTVYGQLVLKWQVGLAGPLPTTGAMDQVGFVLSLLLRPWVLSGLAAAFAAALFWMAALTRFELSRAYPFTAFQFVLVIVLGAWLFSESLSTARIAGCALIIAGVVLLGWE